jgi:hypothetical protein
MNDMATAVTGVLEKARSQALSNAPLCPLSVLKVKILLFSQRVKITSTVNSINWGKVATDSVSKRLAHRGRARQG